MDRFAHLSLALLIYALLSRELGLELHRAPAALLRGPHVMLPYLAAPALCLIGARLPDAMDRGRGPGHRGAGHSLLALGVCSSMAWWIGGLVSPELARVSALFLGAGQLSHLLLDWITYEGVPWLWPAGRKSSLRICKAGGLLIGLIGLLSLVLALRLLLLPT